MKVHKCDGDGKVDWVVVKSTIRRDALHFKLTRVKPFSHTVNWVGLEEKTGIAEGGRAETDLAASQQRRAIPIPRDTGKPDQTKTILSNQESPPKSNKNGSRSNRDSDSCM